MPVMTYRKPAPARHRPTSITQPLSPQEVELIKGPPRKALKAFKEGIADSNCWYVVTMRVQVGYELAKAHFSEQTQAQYAPVMLAVQWMRSRYHVSGNTVWSATPDELRDLEVALDAVDGMQDMTSRLQQLDAYRKALAYMKAVC